MRHAYTPSLVLLACGMFGCAERSARLPSASDFTTLSHQDSYEPIEPNHDSSVPSIECAAATCSGCCSADLACIELLTNDSCARPGETCRDCTRTGLVCDDDASCVNPMLDGDGRVDDRRVHVDTLEDALRMRTDLLVRIFGAPHLPSLEPAAITSDVADPFEVAADDVLIERVEVDLPGGTRTPFWILTPPEPSGQLVLIHQGHWHTLKEGRLGTVAENALSRDAIVVGLPMPLFGESTGPVATHDDLIARFPSDLPGHGSQVFLTPVSVAIDLLETRHDLHHIAMVGISGGGWTTMVYSALDPRIDLSIPIAGGEPLYQRTDLDWGDREQYDNHLYEVAGTLDLYVLATLESGRAQRSVLHRYDTCCFAGTGYQEWEADVQRASADLGGGAFSVFLDESIRGHEVSQHALEALVSPALAGERARYFDDTLPSYGTFAVEGDWSRDGSSGFGNDAARGTSGTATWTIPIGPGDWSAALTWAESPELSADTPVTLQVDGEDISQRIDQRVAPSDDRSAGASWHQLGAGTAATATELTVRLTVPEGGDVRADAVRVTAEWGH